MNEIKLSGKTIIKKNKRTLYEEIVKDNGRMIEFH